MPSMAETMEILQRQQERDDRRAVMNSPEGRRFVWKILTDAGLFNPSFVPGAQDVTAFNEGARNIGLMLLGAIMHDAPEKFLTMQKEAMENEQKKQECGGDRNGEEADGYLGGGDSHH